MPHTTDSRQDSISPENTPQTRRSGYKQSGKNDASIEQSDSSQVTSPTVPAGQMQPSAPVKREQRVRIIVAVIGAVGLVLAACIGLLNPFVQEWIVQSKKTPVAVSTPMPGSTFTPSLTPAVMPTKTPITSPTPTPRIIYDWRGEDRWKCWQIRYDPGTGRWYGNVLTVTAQNFLEFHVDFSTAAENKGQVLYLGTLPACPTLHIPSNATIQADVRMLDDRMSGVETEIFMQTVGNWEWFAGRPTVPLTDTGFRTIRPENWVTGVPPTPISWEGKTEFVTLGVEFKRTPSSGMVRFVIARVWVTAP